MVGISSNQPLTKFWKTSPPTLLISCLQGGFGDTVLLSWLISEIKRYYKLSNVIAVLPQERPQWFRQALSDITIWQMRRYWPPDDLFQLEKHDRLISSAARNFNICQVETLGPYKRGSKFQREFIPTYGSWPRCDRDLYARLTDLANEGIFPKIGIKSDVVQEVDGWLRRNGLITSLPLVVLHVRTDGFYPFKNPSPSRIAELVERLLVNLPIVLVLLGTWGPNAVRHEQRYMRYMEHLPMTFLAALLSRASVLIDSDSGIRHLAGAVGTPIVTFDLPTDFLYGPFVPLDMVIRVPANEGAALRLFPFDFNPRSVVDAVGYFIDNSVK